MHPTIMTAAIDTIHSHKDKQDGYVSTVMTTEYLSALDKIQLLDLLTNKTQLLIAARKAGLADPAYSKNIQREVQAIQSELLIRNRSCV